MVGTFRSAAQGRPYGTWAFSQLLPEQIWATCLFSRSGEKAREKCRAKKKGAGDFHNDFRKRLVRDFINTGVIPPQRGERKLAGGSESGLEFRPSACTESVQPEGLNSKQASAHPG